MDIQDILGSLEGKHARTRDVPPFQRAILALSTSLTCLLKKIFILKYIQASKVIPKNITCIQKTKIIRMTITGISIQERDRFIFSDTISLSILKGMMRAAPTCSN